MANHVNLLSLGSVIVFFFSTYVPVKIKGNRNLHNKISKAGQCYVDFILTQLTDYLPTSEININDILYFFENRVRKSN